MLPADWPRVRCLNAGWPKIPGSAVPRPGGFGFGCAQEASRETEEVKLSGWLPVSEAGTESSLHKERSRHLCPSETLNPWAWRRVSQGKHRLEVTCLEDSQEPPAPGVVPPAWGGSWRQDTNLIVSCSRTNHENGAGDRAQTSGTLPTARGTTTPWPHTGPRWTVGSVHSSHLGTKGIFCITEILYIYFVCNEPFSVNIILTAK